MSWLPDQLLTSREDLCVPWSQLLSSPGVLQVLYSDHLGPFTVTIYGEDHNLWHSIADFSLFL
jgi:hypothetical protein